MIIDVHCHAFPSMLEPYGKRDLKTQQMYMQRFVIHPATAVRRMDTGEIADRSEYGIWDDNDKSPTGAYNVNFRAGRFGRLIWEKNGVGYYAPVQSPNMQDMECSPEYVIAQMDFAGISMAVLQNAYLYGDLNDYFAEAVKKYPDRLIGSIQINEAFAFCNDQMAELRRAADLGMGSLYFSVDRFFEVGYVYSYDDERFTPFWNLVRELELTVLWDISAIEEPGDERLTSYNRFMKQMLRFEAWHNRYPEIKCSLVHGAMLRHLRIGDSGLRPVPEEFWRIWKRNNVYLELLIPIQVSHPVENGSIWDYPYLEAQPLLQETLSVLGSEKLMWGSDLPNSERNCTFKQCLTYLDHFGPALSKADRELIFCQNAKRFFRIL